MKPRKIPLSLAFPLFAIRPEQRAHNTDLLPAWRFAVELPGGVK
jgi:hypothetical protein